MDGSWRDRGRVRGFAHRRDSQALTGKDKQVGKKKTKAGFTTAERRSAALFHALANAAKKSAVREALEDGRSYVVDVVVAGTIDRQQVTEKVAGRLSVGRMQKQNSSQAAPAADVVGYLLGQLSKRKRDAVLAELPATFAESGELPELAAEDRERATKLLNELRSTTSIEKRGAVSFKRGDA